jgi:hypothetical protein
MSGDGSCNGKAARIQRAVACFEQRVAEYLAGDAQDEEEPTQDADGESATTDGDTAVAAEDVAEQAERIRITPH